MLFLDRKEAIVTHDFTIYAGAPDNACARRRRLDGKVGGQSAVASATISDHAVRLWGREVGWRGIHP